MKISKLKFSSLVISLGCVFSGSLAMASSLSESLFSRAAVEEVQLPDQEFPQDNYHLKISFGLISKSEFNDLRGQFKTDSNESFNPQKNYVLEDFLPSYVNDVLGKTVAEKSARTPKAIAKVFADLGHPLQDTDNQTTNLNCHSFTWQWINYIQGQGRNNIFLYGVAGIDLFTQLENFSAYKLKDAQAGDILFIDGPGGMGDSSGILHSAVILSGDYVLEKTDWGENYYFRVARMVDVIGKYKKNRKGAQAHVYRLDSNYELPRYEELKSFAIQAAIFSQPSDRDENLSYVQQAYDLIPKNVRDKYLLFSTYQYEQTSFSVYPITEAAP